MSPRRGRQIHLALMVAWIVVGLPVSFWLRQSVPSVYAIIVGHASGWSAERPSEIVE